MNNLNNPSPESPNHTVSTRAREVAIQYRRAIGFYDGTKKWDVVYKMVEEMIVDMRPH